MTEALERIVRRFQSADRQMRLELLLDFSKKLPSLPERYQAARDQGLNRVHECQSPVFLFMENGPDGIVLHADAPREAPTVRGFVSLLARAVQGATPIQVAALPPDLIEQLGLGEALGMTRLQGLSAMIGRLRRMGREESGD